MPTTHHFADDDMVDAKVGAKIAGVHPNTLRRWGHARLIPRYRTPAGIPVFKVSDLRNIVRPDTHQPAEQAS